MPPISTIDSHAHLVPRFFQNQTDFIAQEAKEHGIAVINSVVEPEDYVFGIEFAEKHENIFLALGLDASLIIQDNLDYERALKRVIGLAAKIVAVGEVGLDYHWVKEQKGRQIQQRAFLQAIETANNLNLPIIIHSRKAESECLNLLQKHAQTDVILHCFSGTPQQACLAVDQGWYISIPTAVAQRKIYRRLTKVIPLDNLILETDSPFLSPDPSIKSNKPIMIIHAVEKVAQIKKESAEEVNLVTSRNCNKIFNLGLILP
ncbi:MAG: TatD family hydrolase [Candidatus Hodarchaeales archaeon]